jgi:hypothetical protein
VIYTISKGAYSVNVQETHYLFGYGSLINALSRSVTGQTGQAHPAWVKGYQRHWSTIGEGLTLSTVAVTQSTSGVTNGVLVEVPASELAAFDEREFGYRRTQVDPNALKVDGECDLSRPVWIYYKDAIIDPHEAAPIVLSYADVILAGCLSISHAFATEFVETTLGWQTALVNDRHAPRYPRVQPEIDVKTLEPYLSAVAHSGVCVKTGYAG